MIGGVYRKPLVLLDMKSRLLYLKQQTKTSLIHHWCGCKFKHIFLSRSTENHIYNKGKLASLNMFSTGTFTCMSFTEQSHSHSQRKTLELLENASNSETVYKIVRNEHLSTKKLSEAFIALKRIVYSNLALLPWIYSDNEQMMFIQSVVNSDGRVYSNKVTQANEFQTICSSVRDNATAFSDEELTNILHAILRLNVKVEDETATVLLMECMDRLEQFDWKALQKFCECASMMNKSGFPLQSKITSIIQHRLDSNFTCDLNAEVLAQILVDNGYFMSQSFLERLLKIIINKLNQDYLKPNSNRTVKILLNLLESVAHFLPEARVTQELLANITPHILHHVPQMSSFEIAKVRLYTQMCRYHNYDICDSICRRAEHLLSHCVKAVDIVNIMTAFHNNRKRKIQTPLKQQLEDLVVLNIHEFDVMLLKHCSSSLLELRLHSRSLTLGLANRVIQKWTDIVETLSCLRSMLRLLTKPHYRVPQLEHFLHEMLTNELELQLGMSPVTVSMITAYLIPCSMNIYDDTSLLQQRISVMIPQFHMTQIHSILQSFHTNSNRRERHSRWHHRSVQSVSLLQIQNELVQEVVRRCKEIESLHMLNLMALTVSAMAGSSKVNIIGSRLMDQYHRLLDLMEPRYMFETCQLFFRLSYYDSQYLEKLTNYAVSNADDLKFADFLKLMQLLGKVVYQPAKLNNLLGIAMKV